MGKFGRFISDRMPAISWEENYSLSAHTTVGVGGVTDAFFPRDMWEAAELFALLRAEGVPFFPLGAGSNVLAPDGGYDGVVISSANLNIVCTSGDGVLAESGASVGKLLSFCLKEERTGAEFLTGIPATVGGLLYMNGGTARGRIGDLVESVTFVGDEGVRTLPAGECRFAYKESLFQHCPCFILSATLRLGRGRREEIRALSAQIAASRRHLPAGRSMGCVFRNPEGVPAGKLIEECGFAGVRVGGARVSEKHANFILNEGGATEADFRALIQTVRESVREKTGIVLREEIRYMQ